MPRVEWVSSGLSRWLHNLWSPINLLCIAYVMILFIFSPVRLTKQSGVYNVTHEVFSPSDFWVAL